MVGFISGLILATYSLVGISFIMERVMDRQERLTWFQLKYQDDSVKAEKEWVVEEAERIIKRG